MKVERAAQIAAELITKKGIEAIVETEWQCCAEWQRGCAVQHCLPDGTPIWHDGIKITIPGCPGERVLSRRALSGMSEAAVRTWIGGALRDLTHYGLPRKGMGGKTPSRR